MVGFYEALRRARFRGGLLNVSEANVAAGAGRDLLRVAEVAEQVFPAAGLEVRVRLDVPEVVVGRAGQVFEAAGDPAPVAGVQGCLKPDVYQGAARDSLGDTPSTIIR